MEFKYILKHFNEHYVPVYEQHFKLFDGQVFSNFDTMLDS